MALGCKQARKNNYDCLNLQHNKIKDAIWNKLSSNFDEIRLLEPKNHSSIFNKMSKYLLTENFKKSDIAYLALHSDTGKPFISTFNVEIDDA